ncbi:hypothetical protein JH06_1713 [Blastocystis sp. subtype 4]|uniref:hypothetical protein n=1 Tax=Blastocystis sp. subtype 4 TaxID=944170 RepID=UPI000711B0E2|nr:hypothetical protein JH06_1713 [Blastocystis sp. subtype 4]KNB44382.1 hypothetical protein JH06_1713 [Blastocystis sp. subtype 4]|eukprot:XP_014527825.1 hypothetical protein JH06_1713 [Blastocystis sp. subtype 4]
MKYTNWVEFKIAAMTLFLHNPEIVDGSLYGLYAEHKKDVTVSCTDNDIHIEFHTSQHNDLRKIDQLVQWVIAKTASDLSYEECNIRSEIEDEKQKRSNAN